MAKLFKNADERALAHAIGRLNFTNPFSEERILLEREIIGADYRDSGGIWHLHSADDSMRSNIALLKQTADELTASLRRRLSENTRFAPEDIVIYETAAIYSLFESYRPQVWQDIQEDKPCPSFAAFSADFAHLLQLPKAQASGSYTPERSYAIFAQITRAFSHIFDVIVGSSPAAAKLRADIWQSIFSFDIYRYNRVLYDRMNNLTTLITGESGSGKELVARAIACSQYIPFNPATRRFAVSYKECFLPIQLSAMPTTLLDSELFGHRKGAYTGALEDRAGVFESCPASGTVFLDEIGEISEEIQVKLLRILQNRTFISLGDTRTKEFKGKVVAATNRDLTAAIEQGRFRSDLYYRLCADVITTPPLRRMLNGKPEELLSFVKTLAARLLGAEEAREFAPKAVAWIFDHLGADYPWQGNVRELEQCIRNLIIRGNYTPPAPGGDNIAARLEAGDLTCAELLRRYARIVYAKHNANLSRAAEALQIDRRTLKSYLDE